MIHLLTVGRLAKIQLNGEAHNPLPQ